MTNPGNRQRFPKGRYKLALIDALLDKPYLFDLDEKVVTVGFYKGRLTLPTELMGLGDLLEIFPQEPLLKLTYNCHSKKWFARSTFPDPEDCAQQSLSVASSLPSHAPEVDNGEPFKVHLPGKLGFFWFKLVDTVETPNILKAMATRLSTLPQVALLSIAGMLEPVDFIHGVCITEPSATKIMAESVAWTELSFFKTTDKVLDTLRVLHLSSQASLRKLEIAEFQPRDEGSFHLRRTILSKIARLAASPALKKLRIKHDCLALLRGCCVSLEKVQIDVQGPSVGRTMWAQLGASLLAPSVLVRVEMMHQKSLGACCAKGDKSVHLTAELQNPVEVSWTVCKDCPMLPLKSLPNLRSLEITAAKASGVPYGQLAKVLANARLDNLEVLLLPAENTEKLGVILHAFVESAPNVSKLALTSVGSASACSLDKTFAALDGIKDFGKLKSLELELCTGSFSIGDLDLVMDLVTGLGHVESITFSNILFRRTREVLVEKLNRFEDLGREVDVRGHDGRDERGDVSSGFDVVVRG